MIMMMMVRTPRHPPGHPPQGALSAAAAAPSVKGTANLRTKILGFRWFESSTIVSLRGGILMPIGDFPESLSQRTLAGR